MSNLYTATANLHKAVQEKAKELGLEIEIKSDYYWCKKIHPYEHKGLIEKRIFEPVMIHELEIDEWPGKYRLSPAIQAPQIRQILLAFQIPLEELRNKKTSDSVDTITYALGLQNKTYAEVLCAKYLDGLNPMFDREPEKVLEELTEIINNI